MKIIKQDKIIFDPRLVSVPEYIANCPNGYRPLHIDDLDLLRNHIKNSDIKGEYIIDIFNKNIIIKNAGYNWGTPKNSIDISSLYFNIINSRRTGTSYICIDTLNFNINWSNISENYRFSSLYVHKNIKS